jgi:hypothetical protein
VKLAEAEKKLAEKNSELIRKEGEFQLKRKTDSDTIQKQQKELGGLRNYMETVEKYWDLLNSDVMGKVPELYSNICAKLSLLCSSSIVSSRSSWI